MTLVTILARDVRLKVLDQALEILRGALVMLLARETRLENFSTILGDIASAVTHDIGANNAIENLNNPWTCCECRKSGYWREICD